MGLIDAAMNPDQAPGQPQQGAPQPAQQSPQPGQPTEDPRQTQMNAEEVDDEGDPETLVAAINAARELLYKKKGAVLIKEAIRTSGNAASGAADVAYQVAQLADQKVGGVDPSDLAALGASILQEVVDICKAIKMPLKGSEQAEAMKQMILRVVKEGGGDTAELESAMSKADLAEFDSMDEESGETNGNPAEEAEEGMA